MPSIPIGCHRLFLIPAPMPGVQAPLGRRTWSALACGLRPRSPSLYPHNLGPRCSRVTGFPIGVPIPVSPMGEPHVSTRSGRRLRRMITSTAGAVAGWALATQAAAQPAPAERANILLIIMDDVGVDTTSDMYPGLIDRLAGRYGPNGRNHPQHERIVGRPASTPVLEAFASESMVFTEAWAQPFCSPTRASILTGLYASRTGVLDYTGWLDQRHHSPARDFQRAGYATAAFGKWHMAGLNRYPGMKPKEAGFDLFLGNLNGAIQAIGATTIRSRTRPCPRPSGAPKPRRRGRCPGSPRRRSHPWSRAPMRSNGSRSANGRIPNDPGSPGSPSTCRTSPRDSSPTGRSCPMRTPSMLARARKWQVAKESSGRPGSASAPPKR